MKTRLMEHLLATQVARVNISCLSEFDPPPLLEIKIRLRVDRG